ncbi:MerR family DNA-binding transcriptional regulator [Thermogemmatispora sp.]|uniref:MerR family DNA-binding transcriptional regulator n=1 Tax=Thermogemmatispora sp. TaxID=1968838 RepID=UPI0035E3F73C
MVWNSDTKDSLGTAAKELGVPPEMLHRWEAEGKVRMERTPGGCRRAGMRRPAFAGGLARNRDGKSRSLSPASGYPATTSERI